MKTLLFQLLFLALFLTACVNSDDRYELVFSAGGTRFLVDKKEGTVWFEDPKKREWVNLGSPPKEAPKKGDRSKLPE